MADDNFSKTFFLGSLFLLLALTAVILFPFLTAIMSGAIFAYVSFPAYNYLSKKFRNKHIAAGIIVLILVILITIISYFVVTTLSKEGYSLFITAKQKLASNSLEVTDCLATPGAFCELSNKFIDLLKNPQFKFYIEDGISKISNFVIDKTSEWVVNLPTILIDLVIMFFMIYYFLVDGTKFVDKLKKSVPLKSHHMDDIIIQFDELTYATLYGNLVTAIIQGFIGGVVFFALGLSTPLLAGIAMAFFAFLPIVGTPIIWVPTAISLFIAGQTTKAVILLLLGIFVISTIDNIIKPEIIGKRTRLHPAGILIGILGGIYTMGLIGIIVGPLIISLFISFIEVYYKEEMNKR